MHDTDTHVISKGPGPLPFITKKVLVITNNMGCNHPQPLIQSQKFKENKIRYAPGCGPICLITEYLILFPVS